MHGGPFCVTERAIPHPKTADAAAPAGLSCNALSCR